MKKTESADMSEEFPPLVYVDLEYSMPKIRIPGRRPQPWRWTARSGDNHQVLAISSERYTNKQDCLDAVTLLFGPESNVYLRQQERGA